MPPTSTATDDRLRNPDQLRRSSVAPPAPLGVPKPRDSNRYRMKVQWQVTSLRGSEATKQSISPRKRKNGLLRCARNDVERVGHTSASSRRITPELCQQTRPRKSEGAGNAGCPRHPRPVCIGSKHTVVTTGTPEHPAFSCAMVLTVSFVLSPATNSFLSPSPSGLTATSPGWAGFASARLSISNGCQDHTTSPYAATSANASTGHVLPAKILAKALKRRSSARRSIAHRKPALRLPLRANAAASTASHPASVTTRDPPLCGWDGGVSRTDLGEAKRGKFLA